MSITVRETSGPLGAIVQGLDLSIQLDRTEIAALRQEWLRNHLLIFPDQELSNEDLERYTLYFGHFGVDPFFSPIDGHMNIVAIERKADEKAPLFAESWHSDWSFQKVPPAGTCLYGITIPPVGGQTGFVNQHLAYEQMPYALKSQIRDRIAIHSAATGYAPDGIYGDKPEEADRSMRIIISEEARATQRHPIVRRHPETGVEGIFGCIGYIIGIEGMPDDEARDLLTEVYEWQTREEFIYMHTWQKNMLVMWDNRSVIHRAFGGFDGYDRLLYRTTIAERVTQS